MWEPILDPETKKQTGEYGMRGLDSTIVLRRMLAHCIGLGRKMVRALQEYCGGIVMAIGGSAENWGFNPAWDAFWGTVRWEMSTSMWGACLEDKPWFYMATIESGHYLYSTLDRRVNNGVTDQCHFDGNAENVEKFFKHLDNRIRILLFGHAPLLETPEHWSRYPTDRDHLRQVLGWNDREDDSELAKQLPTGRKMPGARFLEHTLLVDLEVLIEPDNINITVNDAFDKALGTECSGDPHLRF